MLHLNLTLNTNRDKHNPTGDLSGKQVAGGVLKHRAPGLITGRALLVFERSVGCCVTVDGPYPPVLRALRTWQ